ncbi:MAG: hypothetical protein FJW30_12660 [Acidobacteria bacterium]|nr:hypothetical protein [Acidobacteriota bacterium]
MTTHSVFAPADRIWKLPPLILHPFSDASGPNKLVESSRASLMLQGMLPNNEFTVDELDKKLLDGRFCEIRMLFYVGKDLIRWVEQCMDIVGREEELKREGVNEQSFANLLIEDPPENVREKLRRWGVADYRSIFSRAFGLNMVFADAPGRLAVADTFIRHYYRYADHMYACYQSQAPGRSIRASAFQFDLFASGEYSRMLEREWQGPGEPN